MNGLFGGNISQEEMEKLCDIHKECSKKFKSYEPKLKTMDFNNLRLGVITGRNSGTGIAKYNDKIVMIDGDIYNKEVLPEISTDNNILNTKDELALKLAYLFDKEGVRFAEKLAGMFALVLYDKEKNKVTFIRDSKGYRMLFYSYVDGVLTFGTRIWSVALSCQLKLERDINVESFYLIYGFSPKGKTIFKNIKTVPPGEAVSIDIKNNLLNSFKLAEKYEPKILSKTDFNKITKNDALEVLYNSFLKSLQEIVGKEKRCAVLLGGLDSATVASGLKRIGCDVETISFKWKDKRYNQTYVNEFQNYLGLKHHWYDIDCDFIKNGLKDMFWYVDEPRSELTYQIGTNALGSYANDLGFNLAFLGDASEDIYLGYPVLHKMNSLIKLFSQIPKTIIRIIIKIGERRYFAERYGHAFRNVMTVLRRALYTDEKKYFMTFRLFDESEIIRLLDYADKGIFKQNDDYLDELLEDNRALTPAFIAHLGNEIGSSIRFKHAGPCGVSDVTMTSPFLHRGFIKTLHSIPKSIRYPKGESRAKDAKYMLREMAKKYKLLPEEVIYQKKLTPGASPIDHWFEEELKGLIKEIITELPDDFSREEINSLFTKKYLLEFYRNKIAPAYVTVHAIEQLISYSLFLKHQSFLRQID